MVMPEVKALHPEWDSVPYQVKRTAVRDACRHEPCQPNSRPTSRPSTWNSRTARHTAREPTKSSPNSATAAGQNPKQSCYIPDDAVTEHGVYHTMLGPLRMAEAIPAEHKECRLVQERGRYWLIVPYPAQCDIETPSGDGVVALDPGVRTFLTYFSETDCGKLGHHAFGASSGSATGSTTSSVVPPRHPTDASVGKCACAQARMRQKITNLVDELHWQLARWLTSNYRIILLPLSRPTT